MEKIDEYKQGMFGEDLKILKSKENDEIVIWFKTNDDNGDEKYVDLRMNYRNAEILGQTLIHAIDI